MRSLPALLVATFVLAGAAAFADGGTPGGEAAYDAAVRTWHAEWGTRRTPLVIDHEACRHYWGTGDPIRARIKAAAPPPSRTAFHDALLAFVDAALATADECLGQSHPTPDWVAKSRETIALRRALARAARTTAPDLPAQWE